MDGKTTIQFIIAASALLALSVAVMQSGVLSSIVMFILMGTVPGTDYALSPDTMINIFTAIMSLLFAHGIVKLLNSVYKRKLINELARHRAQLPSRRYTRSTAQL